METDTSIEEEIRRLEELLLDSELRVSTQEFSQLLADDFVEFGSSGRTYNKQQTIEALRNKRPHRSAMEDFKAKLLAPGVVLATYRELKSAGNEKQAGHSLRCSIWKLIDGSWQIVFHQGTPLNI